MIISNSIILIVKFFIVFFITYIILSMILNVINNLLGVFTPLQLLVKNSSKTKLINKLFFIIMVILAGILGAISNFNVYQWGIISGVVNSIISIIEEPKEC